MNTIFTSVYNIKFNKITSYLIIDDIHNDYDSGLEHQVEIWVGGRVSTTARVWVGERVTNTTQHYQYHTTRQQNVIRQ